MNQNNRDELYHYGVAGMRWGKRKQQLKQEYNSQRLKAKSNYKQGKAKLKAEQNAALRKAIRNQTEQNIEKHGKAGTIAREVIKRGLIDTGLRLGQLGVRAGGKYLANRIPSSKLAYATELGTAAIDGGLSGARIGSALNGAVKIGRTAFSPYERKKKKK